MHKLFGEGILVVFELLLPIALIDNYALADALRVRQELIEPHEWNSEVVHTAGGRCTGRVAERCFVDFLNQVTCLLKFNRQEERAAYVDATYQQISGAAVGRLVRPELEAGGVGLAIEKIEIVLTHEKRVIA